MISAFFMYALRIRLGEFKDGKKDPSRSVFVDLLQVSYSIQIHQGLKQHGSGMLPFLYDITDSFVRISDDRFLVALGGK